MEKNTETEIKLLIAKKDVKALVASPLVAKKTKKGSHKTVKLVNIYFDTRDLLLRQAGIAYRVRQNGKKYEATVKLGKTAAGGLSARQEYNVPVKNAKPNLSVFDDSGLPVDFAALLGTAQIEKLFTVRVKRELRLLQITKDTLVEMAIDQGFISAGGKKETIDEVELEIKEGSLGDLLEYTAK
ncbi:MAG: CYTH domain-containing protein, partial [Succiniclasticum sp.]